MNLIKKMSVALILCNVLMNSCSKDSDTPSQSKDKKMSVVINMSDVQHYNYNFGINAPNSSNQYVSFTASSQSLDLSAPTLAFSNKTSIEYPLEISTTAPCQSITTAYVASFDALNNSSTDNIDPLIITLTYKAEGQEIATIKDTIDVTTTNHVRNLTVTPSGKVTDNNSQ